MAMLRKYAGLFGGGGAAATQQGAPPPAWNILGPEYENLPEETHGPLDWIFNPQPSYVPPDAVDKALNDYAIERMRRSGNGQAPQQ
jgi:hypothetical protein